MLIIHCAYFIQFFFPFEAKSDLNAALVGSLLSASIFCSYHSVGREDLLVSAGKENMTSEMLSFIIIIILLLSCTELGSENDDVAFFLTNILMRSSLSGGIALFSNISGTICQFEHSLSKLLIWQ